MNTVETEVSEESDICQTVIKTIAEAEETDPTELSPPLHEIINLDALEILFTNDQTLENVTFYYNSNEVCVFSDGHVSVKNYNT